MESNRWKCHQMFNFSLTGSIDENKISEGEEISRKPFSTQQSRSLDDLKLLNIIFTRE